MEESILTQDLLNSQKGYSVSGDNESNALIFNKKRKKEVKSDENSVKMRKLNPKQKKRLKNFMERKEKEAKRVQVLKTLSQKTITGDQLNLFHSSKNLGQKETARQKLRRKLNEQRAGLKSQEDDGPQLEIEREVKINQSLPPILPQEIESVPVPVEISQKKKKRKIKIRLKEMQNKETKRMSSRNKMNLIKVRNKEKLNLFMNLLNK